jgi:hypothetical protein
MIHFLKTRLSLAERANDHDGVWAKFLPGICEEHNNELIQGTKVLRSSVNQNNYLSLVGKKYKMNATTDPSLLFNMSDAFRSPSRLARFLWRFKVGDQVLLARKVSYELKKDEGYSHFEKPSVVGNFGPKVYTIKACRTKFSGDLYLVPVYELATLTGLFYESELSPALFAMGKAPETRASAAAAAAAVTATRPQRHKKSVRAKDSGDEDWHPRRRHRRHRH